MGDVAPLRRHGAGGHVGDEAAAAEVGEEAVDIGTPVGWKKGFEVRASREGADGGVDLWDDVALEHAPVPEGARVRGGAGEADVEGEADPGGWVRLDTLGGDDRARGLVDELDERKARRVARAPDEEGRGEGLGGEVLGRRRSGSERRCAGDGIDHGLELTKERLQ